MAYRFREAREKAGLSTYEVAKRIGVSQPAVNKWDNGIKLPSVEMLCKLADMYCVSTDYLLGRENPGDYIPKNDEIIAVEALRALNGKPVWNDSKGWGIVNVIQDYFIRSHTLRTSYDHSTIRHNLNCNGLPITLHGFVCNGVRHGHLISH